MNREKPENKKKMYIGAAAIVITLLVLFAVLFAQSGRIVSVFAFAGTTGIKRGRQEEAAQQLDVFEGMRLQSGDLVWTEEASTVTMMVDDDKMVRLEENSEAAFSEISKAKGSQLTCIDLRKGTIVNDLQRKLEDNVTYEITTPNSTISVRGTYFVVYVGEEEGYVGLVTRVNVYDGLVAVESKNGKIAILHAGDEKVEEWEQWENGLNLPSGNRAVVGDSEIQTLAGVDFHGLHEADLDRLEELVKEGGTALTMEEIAAQREVLAAAVQQEPEITESLEEQETGEETGGEEGLQEAEEAGEQSAEEVEAAEKKADAVPGAPEDGGEQSGGESAVVPPVPAKEQPEENPVTVLPVPETPDVSPGSGGSHGSGGSSSAGGDASSGGGEGDASAGGSEEEDERVKYAPASITVNGLEELQEKIDDLKAKKELLKAGPDTTGALAEAETKINQAQASLDGAKATAAKVNAVLDSINALPYPSEITAGDSAQVWAARADYNGLTDQERALVPVRSVNKMTACEDAVAAAIS